MANLVRANSGDDWFAQNLPTAQPVAQAQGPGADSGGGNAQNAAGRGVSPEQYYRDWTANFGVKLKQSDPAGWDRLIHDMQVEGYDVSANVDPNGYRKGLNIGGQFVKLLDGSDRPIYMPGGDQGTSGGGGAGGNSNGAGQAFTPPPFQPSAAWTEQFQGPTQADFDADASYQEQLKRGQQAIERSAASRGTVLNPGTLKDLSDWSQGTASAEGDKLYGRKAQEYGQRYQQYVQGVQQQASDQARQYAQGAGTFGINYGVWNDDVNRFIGQQNTAFNQNLSLAQLGLYGANGVTGAGTNYANQGGQNITGGSNATAAGVVGSANAITGAIGSGLNAGTSLYGLSRYGSPYGSAQPVYSANTEGYQW